MAVAAKQARLLQDVSVRALAEPDPLAHVHPAHADGARVTFVHPEDRLHHLGSPGPDETKETKPFTCPPQ